MAPFFIMSLAIAIDSIVPVRATASDRAEQVSELLFGEAVRILHTEGNWAHIQCIHDQYTGFADLRMFEGTAGKLPGRIRLSEPVTATTKEGKFCIPAGGFIPGIKYPGTFRYGRKQFHIQDPPDRRYPLPPTPDSLLLAAAAYLGTPYRWGGRSHCGIDCSGFIQQVYGAVGIALPRDAWQQAEKGRRIDYFHRKPGDLAFFTNPAGKITHVGMVGRHLDIIHASVRVRKDYLFSTGVYSVEYKSETHSLYLIKRIL